MATLLVYAPGLEHTWPDHPENSGRLKAVREHLQRRRLWDQLKQIEPTPATEVQLAQVHATRVLTMVNRLSSSGGGMITGDTYVTAASYTLARLAAGGCCRAVDGVLQGEAANGLALVRPPGHHAERAHVSGFCLFNNVAVAARYAQVEYGLERILIIDFDVHHGNGTQDIFYEDPSVLFVSVHLHIPLVFYPGTGASHETGRGPGAGYNMNVPLPPHVGDRGYDRVFSELVRPKVVAFKPQLVLVSVGFDAHWADPLSVSGLTLPGYAAVVRRILALADELCGGRVIFVLEGGYQRQALTSGVANLASALLGHEDVEDPLGPVPHPEPDIDDLISDIGRRQRIW